MGIFDKTLGVLAGLFCIYYGFGTEAWLIPAGIIFIILELVVSYDSFVTLSDTIIGGELGGVFKKWITLGIISAIIGYVIIYFMSN